MSRVPRRRAPRSIADVLETTLGEIAPSDPLSRLQAAWPKIVGVRVAGHCAPARLRRDGAIAVRCDSGALASELALREPTLRRLIAETLELDVALRFEGPSRR